MPMENLGGELFSELAVTTWGASRLDVFARGRDNAIWHKWHDVNGWGEWESLGGNVPSNPVAVSWGVGRLDVFVRGPDNILYHKWHDVYGWGPSQLDWEPLGGELFSDPCVVSWGPNRLDVFGRDRSNATKHLWHDIHGWGGWESLGGNVPSNPVAASWGAGRLDVFARGSDNMLYHKWFDVGGWGPSQDGWERLFLSLASDPCPIVVRGGYYEQRALHVLGRTPFSNSLSDCHFTDTWHVVPLGGNFSSNPTAVSWGPGRLDAFVRSNNTLWHWWFLFESVWLPGQGNWENLGVDCVSEPRALSWTNGRLDVFGRGRDNALWHKWYDRGW